MTDFKDTQIPLAEGLPDDPVGICAAVQGLVIQPQDALAARVREHRIPEKNIRPVRRQLEILAALDPAPLHLARPPSRRIVGTCRNFALLGCALLRLRATRT